MFHVVNRIHGERRPTGLVPDLRASSLPFAVPLASQGLAAFVWGYRESFRHGGRQRLALCVERLSACQQPPVPQTRASIMRRKYATKKPNECKSLFFA